MTKSIKNFKFTAHTDKYVVWICDRGHLEEFDVPEHPHTFFTINMARPGCPPETVYFFNCLSDFSLALHPDIEEYMKIIESIQAQQSELLDRANELAVSPAVRSSVSTIPA